MKLHVLFKALLFAGLQSIFLFINISRHWCRFNLEHVWNSNWHN